MMRIALLCALLAATVGCPHQHVYTDQDLEIARDPTILYTRSEQWMNMHLRGVRVGDPADELLKRRIVSRNEAGWVQLRSGARYLIKDNQVKGLGVWDQRLLAKLEITSPADIEMKFGKPESIDDLGREKIYRYRDNHVRVMWSDFERRVTTVNVVQ
jgi:hypothetical protein